MDGWMALPFPKMTKSPLIENPHGTVEEKKTFLACFSYEYRYVHLLLLLLGPL